MKKVIIPALLSFLIFCAILIARTGLFTSSANTGLTLLQAAQADANAPAPAPAPEVVEAPALEADTNIYFEAADAERQILTLGSTDPESGYEFELALTSKGAAIETATLSRFTDLDPDDPQPLKVLNPIGEKVLSMANGRLIFENEKQRLPLDLLEWKSLGVVKPDPNTQKAAFEALITSSDGQDILRITKTYTVVAGRYHLDCNLNIENLSDKDRQITFGLTGPAGIGREGFRGDMRKAVGGFVNTKGEITSNRFDLAKSVSKTAYAAKELKRDSDTFLWAAIVNKYFAGILVPVSDDDKTYVDWVKAKTGQFYNPDGKKNTGDENLAIAMQIPGQRFAPGASRNYSFELYIGPKDKRLFDKNPHYKTLGFVQTIDFLACCCPTSIISPLAFGILALMEIMYSFIGNYGVVIIILVLLIRVAMHPITKKSQVSMSKFSKLAPKMEEIKKKYANNKAELNKRMMELYREQGASPVMGFLPMLVQMPIWIALYSAIYSSITLRGAAFLPFWITDLSAPDALIRFATITVPLLGWKIESLNLLPILMGVAMYLQQKMMPKQPSANPQAAQQQKMMMIMMPLMFPIFLYKAPSGLNLYIMASTFAGVIEQHVIRKHIREREEAESKGLVPATSKTGGKVKKKKPKPFFKKYH